MKLVVMIPAYNEEESIGKVIREIPREIDGIEDIEVVVINDGSTDNTEKVAIESGAHHVITHKRNLGLARAFKTGLDYALKLGADVIVNIDADGQYNAKEIPKLISPILEGEADIVIGDRQIDKLDHMPKAKKIGNKIATWVTAKLAGIDVRDAQSGFRAFSRKAAMMMNVLGDYTYVQETIIQAANKGLKIEWIPIKFRKREGKSRLIPNIWSYAKRAGMTILRTYRDYHPLSVFLGIGGILLLVGLIFALRVLIHYIQTGMVTPYLPSAVLAVMLIVVGSITIVFGLVADMLKMQRLMLEEVLYRLKEMEEAETRSKSRQK
ncbi:glycosyltransferase family 2 protein [Archaeoglobus profundus]|uniref:Glycosyl transferase family 2 n=1 Tax=Archaeoglobus profundus (strain DSM 5631 / JCM 9629 / NBRC 100127 / Av18) TaxID=572546 RepID=D2RDS2_ARCPA|nr:glycosyltransferase family 2 protein [Archaeoglobus profundus]ADB58266.1 glycosyl transferase family 2 [Archaeoglobus profundus DSM 5631]